MHDLRVISAPDIIEVLDSLGPALLDIVEKTYLLHADGRAVNPDSYFLRFPDDERNRIIALPAAILDDGPVAGIKWIASYPKNPGSGLRRASAVIVLNDSDTGYPVAFLEGARISAARTAFSAALALKHLSGPDGASRRIGVIGAGFIAWNVLKAIKASGLRLDQVLVYDLDQEKSLELANGSNNDLGIGAGITERIEDVFAQDVVLLTTTVARPYITDGSWIRPGQIILNISLRDLGPEVILSNWNMVDDVEHCLKANTSPHLAEQASGGRDFIAGTIAQLVRGRIEPDRGKGLIFSPFGLGVLDLAFARVVFEEASRTGKGLVVRDFHENAHR